MSIFRGPLAGAYAEAIDHASGSGVSVVGQDGVVIHVNRALCRMLGFSREELVGQSPPFSYWPPEHIRPIQEAFRLALNGQFPASGMELVLQTREGRRIPVLIFVAPLLIGGATAGWVANLVDLTAQREKERALRESEARFREIAERIEEVFYLFDVRAGAMQYINPAFERVWGIPLARVVEQPWVFVEGIAPEDQERVQAALQRQLAGEVTRVEYRVLRPDGSEAWVYDQSFPVRDEDGAVARIVGIAADVTPLRQAQVALQRQEALLRQAQQMEALGRLTGGLAHDFNNLLGIIIGNLDEVSQPGRSAADIGQSLDNALSAALRGAELTRSLLAVARRRPLELAPVDINARLTQLLPLLRNSAGAAVDVRLQGSAEEIVCRADVAGFDSALVNLVVNARDAMPQGGSLVIRAERRDIDPRTDSSPPALAPGAYAVIEVCDSGVGMPQHVADRAFDSFFTTKADGVGTGLGLPIVHSFATQLGGTAVLESLVGVGTTVRLYLPLSAERTPAPAAERRGALQDVKVSGRILVVDDEPVLLRIASTLLSRCGYEVCSAGSAREALELLGGSRFDLLFSDIVMPGGTDGIALARQVSQRWPELPVVLTTGFSPQVDLPRLPWRIVEKPYRPTTLPAVFEEVRRNHATATIAGH